MTDLLKVLIQKETSVEAAKSVLKGMIEEVNEGEDPEEVLFDYGLEPDYVIDLVNYLH